MATTFTIRIEATNLRVARNEYEALGRYIDHMESIYGKPAEETKAEPTPETPKKMRVEASATVTKSETETVQETEAPKKTTTKKKTVKKEEPKVEEPKAEEPAVETDITHADIVALAREAVKVTNDRTAVDKVIKRYGHPISKITPNNFEAVTSDLKRLIEAA